MCDEGPSAQLEAATLTAEKTPAATIRPDQAEAARARTTSTATAG
jgi:hypothetical protein